MKPKSEIKNIPEFKAITFYSKKNKFKNQFLIKINIIYLIFGPHGVCLVKKNITLLVDLSKNNKLEIIGLNYKDKLKNAEKFLNELGNPYRDFT